MKKKDIITLIIGFLLIIIFSYLMLQRRVRQAYDFFWGSTYMYIVYASLMLAFIFIIFRKTAFVKKMTSYLKYPAYILFLPFAVLPIIRCYFKVPFIFCKACPRKCPWGLLRPVIVPAFLLQNLDCRFWCYKLCPFGTMQDYNAKLTKKKICLPAWLKVIRYIILALTVLVVIGIIYNLTFLTRGFFYRDTFHYVIPTIIAAAIIFILTFFIPRFWCVYFCPIGSFSDLVLKAENRLKNRDKKCMVDDKQIN